jgi:hypothetical protein
MPRRVKRRYHTQIAGRPTRNRAETPFFRRQKSVKPGSPQLALSKRDRFGTELCPNAYNNNRGNFMLLGDPAVVPATASQLRQTMLGKRRPGANPNLNPIATAVYLQKVPQRKQAGKSHLHNPFVWKILAITPLDCATWRRTPPTYHSKETVYPQGHRGRGGGGSAPRIQVLIAASPHHSPQPLRFLCLTRKPCLI